MSDVMTMESLRKLAALIREESKNPPPLCLGSKLYQQAKAAGYDVSRILPMDALPRRVQPPE